MADLFDVQFTMLQKSLDFRARRNDLIASNVANVETPGFKAMDMVFERALGDALRAQEPGPLRVTNSRHFDGRPGIPVDRVKPRVIQSESAEASLDGNSVDLGKEMAKLAENQLAYQALTQMIAHRFSLLKLVTRDGDI
ncbi:MAG: flagellar basal body rod protein FlgB [bacterium]